MTPPPQKLMLFGRRPPPPAPPFLRPPFCRSFSNTVEALLLAVALVIAFDAGFFRADGAEEDGGPRARPWPKHATALGVLLSAGSFARITFPALMAPVIFHVRQ